ncbi:hypothetical protein BDZ91DRAFT_728025 [Kalaharituber pfeilii]|nr:hypothetical protein BDZ91DRAFT_728025 [Kalaharituber pfeilii]
MCVTRFACGLSVLFDVFHPDALMSNTTYFMISVLFLVHLDFIIHPCRARFSYFLFRSYLLLVRLFP